MHLRAQRAQLLEPHRAAVTVHREHAREEPLGAREEGERPRRVVRARADAHLLGGGRDGVVEPRGVGRLDEAVVGRADEEGRGLALRRVAERVDVEDVEVGALADGAADPAERGLRQHPRHAVRAAAHDV